MLELDYKVNYPLWAKQIGIEIDTYYLPEDLYNGDWHYLLQDLIEAYAKYRGWTEDEYWQDDGDKSYKAECEAYELIGDIRKSLNY